jgi:hypothetical protein
MTAIDRDSLIADMAARRPDAVRPTLTEAPRTLRPFAARLHRLAAFITEHQLPEAEIAIVEGSILIEVHDGLIENTVRQWAAALDQVVTTVACDMPDGTAGTLWSASGWDGRGTWWMVTGRAAVPALAVAP